MTKLCIDMSSYLKTSLRAGKDLKDGQLVVFEDEEMLVNSAAYGYENFTNMMLKTLAECSKQLREVLRPIDCLLVFEGRNSKARRLLIDPLYKSKRDKKPPEFYEQFNLLKEHVDELWRGLGAISMSQDAVEADDVLAYLAQESEEDLIICSRDGDLSKLLGTNRWGAKVHIYNDGRFDMPIIDSEPFPHDPKYITLYKALVGDTSDSIPGVKGFGAAMFQNFLEKYGYDGADELMALLDVGKLDALHELAQERAGKDKKVHPIVSKIVEYEADAVRCWKLAKMYPEWVTFHRPSLKNHLTFRPGKHVPLPDVFDHRLKDWYGYQYLITADEYADAVQMLKEQGGVTRDWDFDIETSAPPESDDWMTALGDPFGVDQLGHELTGFSITFGDNKQNTFYVSVDHRDTNNITMQQARELMEIMFDTGKEVIIQNNFFEMSVLAQAADEDGTKWVDIWAQKYPEYRGLIPNTLDTKLEASYVNENVTTSLKPRSKMHLDYDQATFEDTVRKSGWLDELPSGGRVVTAEDRRDELVEFVPDEEKPWRTWGVKQYKMNELTAQEVIAYGCDDTICTGALHRFYKLVMQLEHQWDCYLETEIDASYQHVKSFLDGVPFSLQRMRELEAEDTITYDTAWVTVREYLMQKGWQGTVPPTYTAAITAAEIKEAYRIVVKGAGKGGVELVDLEGMGDEDDEENEAEEPSESEGEESDEDEFLKTRVRTPAKLVVMLRDLGHEMFARMVEECMDGNHEKFTSWVREHFSGEPDFKSSNKQMQKLLYEVMALPIRARNKPTDKMKREGKEGNPMGNALALAYAMRDCTPEQLAVLKGLQLMQMVRTRRNLYYKKYPYFIHWKTGLLHPTHNQCYANTRRASMSKPNTQQLPKHPKIKGHDAKFRETIVPHHPDAVIASLDFDSQELRVIADYSRDENMVSAFVGENKKSLHSLTGHSIALKKKVIPSAVDYVLFDLAAKEKSHELYDVCAEHRALGKKVNFTTEFGAMAPKLAMTLMCTEAEAQIYIDAKEAMFPGVRKWKNSVIAESKAEGIVRTKGGAVRHLADAYMSDDFWRKSKAERQAVNFKVQSSSAEMTKRAEGRMWKMGLVYKYDCVYIGPVHDETVFSVMKKDLVAFLKDAHWCMTQQYADMEIPVESSISFGPNFGQQIEIGIRPTEDAVAKGWEEVAKILAKSKKAAVAA